MTNNSILADNDAGLLSKVLGIVGLSFLFTALGTYLLGNAPVFAFWALVVAVFGLLFALYSQHDNPSAQLPIVYLSAFAWGGILAPALHHYVKSIGILGVAEAAALTATGLVFLGGIAFLFNINYERLSGIGLALLVLLVGVSIANVFLHYFHPHVIDWLTLAVFSVVTVVDFVRVKDGGRGETAPELAMAIYLDALNIFLSILDLLSDDTKSSSSDW